MKHAHAVEEKRVSRAHWRSASAAATRTNSQRKPLRARRRMGGVQTTRHTAKPLPLSVCLHFRLSVCLPVFHHPSLVVLHPHPSLIQFALICREPHLSLRAQGGGGGWVGWVGGEPAHCLCMNQGHLKIKSVLR